MHSCTLKVAGLVITALPASQSVVLRAVLLMAAGCLSTEPAQTVSAESATSSLTRKTYIRRRAGRSLPSNTSLSQRRTLERPTNLGNPLGGSQF